MDFFGAFVGEVFSILAFLIISAGVYKLFQIASDLREMKGLLGDIKRNSHPFAAPSPEARPGTAPMTPEELVRAVHAGSYDDSTPVDTTALPPIS